MNKKRFPCPSQIKLADRWRLFPSRLSTQIPPFFPWSLTDNRRIAYTCFWRHIYSPKSITTPASRWPCKGWPGFCLSSFLTITPVLAISMGLEVGKGWKAMLLIKIAKWDRVDVCRFMADNWVESFRDAHGFGVRIRETEIKFEKKVEKF